MNLRILRQRYAALMGSGGSAIVGFISAGTGAIARTLQSKVREQWFSVTDFGATGDGTTDDLAAILATIAAAVAAGGGVVFFPKGTYATTQAIPIYSNNVFLVGAGRNLAIIRPKVGWVSLTGPSGAAVTGVITFVGVDNVGCEGLQIDKFTNSCAGNGIAMIPTLANGAGTVCTNWYVRNNNVSAKTGSSYQIWCQRGQNGEIAFNYINGNETTRNGSSTQEGIEIYGGYNVSVHHNYLKDIGNSAFMCQTIAATTPSCEIKNVSWTDNIVDGCRIGSQSYITYDATNGAMGQENVVWARNVIRKYYDTGIDWQPSSGNASTPPVARNIVFDSNTFIAATVAEGSLAGIKAINVTGATATIGNFTVDNFAITNNLFYGCYPTTQIGWFHFNAFKGFTFSGNLAKRDTSLLISGNCVGFYAVSCTDFSVERNKIDGARLYAVQLQTCTDFRLSRNTLRNWNIYAGGVAAVDISSTCTDFEVVGNSFFSTTLTSIAKFIGVSSDSNRGRIDGNYYDGTSTIRVLNNAATATDFNAGSFTTGTSSTSTTVTTQFCGANSVIAIIQTAGTLTTLGKVVPAAGSFVVNYGSTADACTFKWAILGQ